MARNFQIGLVLTFLFMPVNAFAQACQAALDGALAQCQAFAESANSEISSIASQMLKNEASGGAEANKAAKNAKIVTNVASTKMYKAGGSCKATARGCQATCNTELTELKAKKEQCEAKESDSQNADGGEDCSKIGTQIAAVEKLKAQCRSETQAKGEEIKGVGNDYSVKNTESGYTFDASEAKKNIAALDAEGVPSQAEPTADVAATPECDGKTICWKAWGFKPSDANAAPTPRRRPGTINVDAATGKVIEDDQKPKVDTGTFEDENGNPLQYIFRNGSNR